MIHGGINRLTIDLHDAYGVINSLTVDLHDAYGVNRLMVDLSDTNSKLV